MYIIDGSKMTSRKEAYEEIYKINHTTGLDTRLHESYGQLIYYYLREGLRTMGGQRAQDVLNEYLSLKNDRPSSIHSSIANMASHVCGEYSEVKLLPFIKDASLITVHHTLLHIITAVAAKSVQFHQNAFLFAFIKDVLQFLRIHLMFCLDKIT